MGNNISKPEPDVENDDLITTATDSGTILPNNIATTSSITINNTTTITTPNRNVSETINEQDTTNKTNTDNVEQFKNNDEKHSVKPDKTDDIKVTEAFQKQLNNNEHQNLETDKLQPPNITTNDQNFVKKLETSDQPQGNLINKNSIKNNNNNKLPSLTKEKTGTEAKYTQPNKHAINNLNLEKSSPQQNENNDLIKDDNNYQSDIKSKILENNESKNKELEKPLPSKTAATSPSPPPPPPSTSTSNNGENQSITKVKFDENTKNVSNTIAKTNIYLNNQQDLQIIPQVSLLLKQTREVICVADMKKKCDTGKENFEYIDDDDDDDDDIDDNNTTGNKINEEIKSNKRLQKNNDDNDKTVSTNTTAVLLNQVTKKDVKKEEGIGIGGGGGGGGKHLDLVGLEKEIVKNCDVKEYSANGISSSSQVGATGGAADVISCQHKIPVNNQPTFNKKDLIVTCNNCNYNNNNNNNNNKINTSLEKMLTIRTNSSGFETFSSSPPKVTTTDSETEDDNNNNNNNNNNNENSSSCIKKEFLPKPICQSRMKKDKEHYFENGIKIKKHVHWADSDDRTLEIFEQCKTFTTEDDEDEEEEEEDSGEDDERNDADDDDDDDDEEDDDEEGDVEKEENVDKEKKKLKISTSDKNEDENVVDADDDDDEEEAEESSSEDEEANNVLVKKPKEKKVEYKRQDTWLDVIIDDVPKKILEKKRAKNISDACATTSLKSNDDEDDSGEEETTSSSSEEDENEEEPDEVDEDENEESSESEEGDNDDDENGIKQNLKQHTKTDKMNSTDTDSNKSTIQVHELYDQIAKLQEEILIKASGLERQRTELETAYSECESVKQRHKQLEDELQEYRCRNTELTLRMCNAESKLMSEGDVEKLRDAEKKIAELESELEKVKLEKLKLEEAIKKLELEREQEVLVVRQALDDTLSEQDAMEVRYKKEFEQLRSLNSNREVQMLDDFEWKLREVEKIGKKKLADIEKELTEKVNDLTVKLAKAEEELSQVAHLKLCEIELKQLRATAHEHRKNLRTVTRQLEDLQVDEKILQEEVNRLRAALDKEKAQIVTIQNSHKEEIAEKERKTHFKLQSQKNQINSEWEDKLKRELARLKNDLERVFREEKMVAIDTEKRIKEHEFANQKQLWEKRADDFKMEINNFKKKLEDREERHKLELESAQTHSDRDVLDLRRQMDKLDMQYQEKIEKLQESHEQEILAVKQECEKKIYQCESSVQLQLGTNRTTLELVKQQMTNECEMRIEQLKRIHQEQLEDQWEQMQLDKEKEIQQLEDEHRKVVELLEKKLEDFKKRNDRSEALTPSLKKQSSKEGSNNNVPSKLEENTNVGNELASSKDSSSSRESRISGREISSTSCNSSSQNRTEVEQELRDTIEKLTKQVYEDKLEIERLREQLSTCTGRLPPQRSTPPQPPYHHPRRNRKSRSGKN